MVVIHISQRIKDILETRPTGQHNPEMSFEVAAPVHKHGLGDHSRTLALLACPSKALPRPLRRIFLQRAGGESMVLRASQGLDKDEHPLISLKLLERRDSIDSCCLIMPVIEETIIGTSIKDLTCAPLA